MSTPRAHNLASLAHTLLNPENKNKLVGLYKLLKDKDFNTGIWTYLRFFYRPEHNGIMQQMVEKLKDSSDTEPTHIPQKLNETFAILNQYQPQTPITANSVLIYLLNAYFTFYPNDVSYITNPLILDLIKPDYQMSDIATDWRKNLITELKNLKFEENKIDQYNLLNLTLDQNERDDLVDFIRNNFLYSDNRSKLLNIFYLHSSSENQTKIQNDCVVVYNSELFNTIKEHLHSAQQIEKLNGLVEGMVTNNYSRFLGDAVDLLNDKQMYCYANLYLRHFEYYRDQSNYESDYIFDNYILSCKRQVEIAAQYTRDKETAYTILQYAQLYNYKDFHWERKKLNNPLAIEFKNLFLLLDDTQKVNLIKSSLPGRELLNAYPWFHFLEQLVHPNIDEFNVWEFMFNSITHYLKIYEYRPNDFVSHEKSIIALTNIFKIIPEFKIKNYLQQLIIQFNYDIGHNRIYPNHFYHLMFAVCFNLINDLDANLILQVQNLIIDNICKNITDLQYGYQILNKSAYGQEVLKNKFAEYKLERDYRVGLLDLLGSFDMPHLIEFLANNSEGLPDTRLEELLNKCPNNFKIIILEKYIARCIVGNEGFKKEFLNNHIYTLSQDQQLPLLQLINNYINENWDKWQNYPAESDGLFELADDNGKSKILDYFFVTLKNRYQAWGNENADEKVIINHYENLIGFINPNTPEINEKILSKFTPAVKEKVSHCVPYMMSAPIFAKKIFIDWIILSINVWASNCVQEKMILDVFNASSYAEKVKIIYDIEKSMTADYYSNHLKLLIELSGHLQLPHRIHLTYQLSLKYKNPNEHISFLIAHLHYQNERQALIEKTLNHDVYPALNEIINSYDRPNGYSFN